MSKILDDAKKKLKDNPPNSIIELFKVMVPTYMKMQEESIEEFKKMSEGLLVKKDEGDDEVYTWEVIGRK